MRFSVFCFICAVVAIILFGIAVHEMSTRDADTARAVTPARSLVGPPLRNTRHACYVDRADGEPFFFPRPCNAFSHARKNKLVHFKIGKSHCTTSVAIAPGYYCSR